jgi:hypothetical protein
LSLLRNPPEDRAPPRRSCNRYHPQRSVVLSRC